jgi:hypothetical protein
MVGGFMNQFNLYCITNIDAEQMVNPMKHTALFLCYASLSVVRLGLK